MTSPPLEPLPMDEQDDAIEVDLDSDQSDAAAHEIRTFGAKKSSTEKQWSRKTNLTGTGAIRVRTFHAKLRDDALEFLDDQINQWLDQHPEYEVKLVTTTVGELKGKSVEAALFVNVWV